MARHQTMVQLTDELVALLDRHARSQGVSRSALIRRVLEEFFVADQEAETGRQIVEGYMRVPQATPDEWGDLAASNERTTRDLMRRLDAEERREGFGPWRKSGSGGATG